MNLVHYEYLGASRNTPWSAEAMVNGTAEYSWPVRAYASNGAAGLIVTLAGAADDIDITYETSLDWNEQTNKGTWYDSIIDTAGTSLNAIYTALGQGTNVIMFDPPLTKWIKFKFDPDANSTVTSAIYFHQEE